jgi:phenylpropionate dioxygenase-like ring-hydroxylating dioxygenase large terminal subunit
MFLHQERLPHLLPPKAYWSPAQHQRESELLFESGWHCVASMEKLANAGDFITVDLLGRPILVRNFDGQIQAYLNVCTHRHSLLTNKACGNSPKLSCQYHGWEYRLDGSTCRIPDARSFRPLPGGPERLKRFATQVRGPLVFVSLAEEPEDLSERLGPLAAVCDEFPCSRWRQAGQWEYLIEANWKIVVENTIESYHVPIVHPHTLGDFTPEEDTIHEISDRSAVMKSRGSAPAFYKKIVDRFLPMLEPGCTHRYRLFHGFPNLFLIRIDATLQVMSVFPLSPESCRLTVRVFTLRAVRESWRSRSLTHLLGRLKVRVIRRILNEDARLFSDLQRGMKASPFQGTISSREELVFAFQDYVRRECPLQCSVETDNAEA